MMFVMETRTQLNPIRERRGVSAAQLAKLAGVSRQTIYAIEAGDYVPNTTLSLQLAQILERFALRIYFVWNRPIRRRPGPFPSIC
jgi:putative molybdopterin biosynthesis protein